MRKLYRDSGVSPVQEERMTTARLTVPEIAPPDFEGELRDGTHVTVIDTRSPEAFAEWRVTAARGEVLNIPEPEATADPAAVLARVPEGSLLRVICNRGIASLRVAAALGAGATSVSGGMIGWSRVLQAAEVHVPGPFGVVQFRREARGCLSYMVTAGGEALVADPAPDVRPYLHHADALGVRITRVFDTHVHADHVSGARELARRTGAPLHVSRAALRRGLRDAGRFSPLPDGAPIPLGGEAVRVVALPGHTTDMAGLLLGDAALIAGDSLFADSVARPDLEGGDAGAPDAARDLHRTLRERVAGLPDHTLLLPCHYPGGRRDGPLTTTLGAARADVPELHLDEEPFVARILGQLPPRPANHLAIIGVNLGDDLPDDAAAALEVGANKCAARASWAAPAA
jgi:glyoxylase-like metal-dependent hydrolase (beta-lactamase superfamily II)/rhodanese-related sulfurtransferase